MPPILKSLFRFIMSQDESYENRLRGILRQRFKQNFGYLKDFMTKYVNINETIKTLRNNTLLTSEMCDNIKCIPSCCLQAEFILKKVYHFTEERCFQFLRLLPGIDFGKLESGKCIPEYAYTEYGFVRKDIIQGHQNYIEDQLEINMILDTLVEYDVITFSDHDEIQQQRKRRRKAQAFMTCVRRKTENEWIIRFLYVLEFSGYGKLAKELKSSRPISPVQDLCIPRGETVRVTARVRALPETENRLLQNNGQPVEETVQAILNSPVVDIRLGSILLLLNIHKNKFAEMQHNFSSLLETLVKEMLNKEGVAESITEKTIVTVELDGMENDCFLNETLDRQALSCSVGPLAEKCSRCLQLTLNQNYDDVLDEIETDVIAETLAKSKNTSDYIRHKCIEDKDSLSRKERANMFMQYVLAHEEVLQSFWRIFLERSEFESEMVLCSECSGDLTKDTGKPQLTRSSFEFTVDRNKQGDIMVTFLGTTDQMQEKISATDIQRCDILLEDEGIHRETLLVAAIDFGTSYSGYAFSTIGSYKTNPLDINCNQSWNTKGKQLISSKTPTCILLTKNKTFVSFGYDAETEYADIVMENQEDEYLFFNRFKMDLHKRDVVSEKMLMEDVRGKSVEAIDVFSMAIRALKEHLMDQINERITIHEQEIKWVLTVPAQWSNRAKEFMRKSAEKAGIKGDQLLIALEPEAASVYYQTCLTHQHVRQVKKQDDNKYMIIDIGGGTVDITVHEKIREGNLKELYPSSGGAYGGTSVDDCFLEFLSKIVGSKVMDHLKKEFSCSFLELLREFECAKRMKLSRKSGKVNFTFPLTVFDQLCERHFHRNFQSIVDQSEYKGKLSVVGDKLRIDNGVFEGFLKSPINKIMTKTEEVLQMFDENELRNVVLVGGFSGCDLLQKTFRLAFPKKEIYTFNDPDLIVLKGAVLFGHKPDFITSRITRFTYGRRIRPRFDPTKHKHEKLIIDDGVERCLDVFEPIIKRGTSVQIGQTIAVQYHTTAEYQHRITVALYASDHDNTMYVDEAGCESLGELIVTIPKPSREIRNVDVNLTFGLTELQAEAVDKSTGTKYKADFQIV